MPRYVPSSNQKGPKHLLFPLFLVIAGVLLVFVENIKSGEFIRHSPIDDWTSLKSKNTAIRWLKKRYIVEASFDTFAQLPLHAWSDIDANIRFTPSNTDSHWKTIRFQAESILFGLRLRKLEDLWIITDVEQASPGYQAGCRPGMMIVDFSPSLVQKNNDNTIEPIDNNKPETITLNIRNPNTNEIDSIRITEDIAEKPNGVKTIVQKLDSTTFYIRPDVWQTKTYHAIMSGLEKAGYLDNQFNNAVLDLRGVGGEEVAEAAKLLSQWSGQKGESLFSLQGPRFKKMEFTSTGKTFTEWGEIVILMDELSGLASASIAASSIGKSNREVIALALPKREKFAESITLPDNSQLQFSVADLFLPNGQTVYDNLEKLHPIGIGELLLPDWELAAFRAAWSIYLNEQSRIESAENIDKHFISLYPQLVANLNIHTNSTFELNPEPIKRIWITKAYFYYVSIQKGEQWAYQNAYLYDSLIIDALQIIKSQSVVK